ncbi:MAG: hypothetical protein K2H01_01465 [Ruminococcus sp.]|nr:hypothetical protein [Ruminococcus sp.]
MKKLSKVLSFILGASISISIAGSINADAIYMESNKIPMTAPEGYVVYELDCEKGELSYRSTTVSDGLYVYGFEYFRYNDIRIKVKDGFDEFEIAQKYLSDVNFNTQDADITYNNGYIWKYDKYVSGDDPRTHESVEDKYKQLSEICAQMYEDGVIEEAVLSPVIAGYYTELLYPHIICHYLYGKEEDFQPLVDEIQSFVDNYTENGEVRLCNYDGAKYYVIIDLYETDLDTYDELAAFRDEIAELYDVEEVVIDYMRPADSKSAASAVINLLDPYICDIDGSGKADITDATAILTAYAESAAGLQKAAADDKMDVNGDGEVNIEDATYVLTYYAEAAAGIR